MFWSKNTRDNTNTEFRSGGAPIRCGAFIGKEERCFLKINVSPHKNICYSQSLSINLQQKYGGSLQGLTEKDILLVLLYMPQVVTVRYTG